MRTTVSKLSALLLTGILAVSSVIPAQAQSVTMSFGQRERVIQTYCDRYPNDYDCRGYYDGYWRDRDYDRFYNNRRSDLDAISAGIFGLAFGAILGGAIAGSNNNTRSNGDRLIGPVNSDRHIAACYARYRSYDARTDTFMGYDGIRRRCNL